ncbi:MAG: amino acid transport protein [Proteobacteria bacterium]|nr:amino acid transport protein [Pseudomonadota bacterium]MBS0463317.1 amino acid transport protein [Pseudomonadota bacterium]MBS0464122.1 amino acid transport protein [Pseudomonadota bacterium]
MNTTWLLLGLVFSSVGFGYLLYGKKQARPLPMLCGIGLMVYPYFIDNVWVMLALGVGLMAVPYFLRR